MLTANTTGRNVPNFPTSAASKTTSMHQNLAKNPGISSALAILKEYTLADNGKYTVADNGKENSQGNLLSI